MQPLTDCPANYFFVFHYNHHYVYGLSRERIAVLRFGKKRGWRTAGRNASLCFEPPVE
jgi:hypothetical protein